MQRAAYILVVERLTGSVVTAVQSLRQESEWRELQIVRLAEQPQAHDRFRAADVPIHDAVCDFAKPETIVAALEPFRPAICGVVCRGDVYIQQLRVTIPFLPDGVHVPSPESLAIATDKLLMRRAFIKHFPEITPRFAEAHDATDATIGRIGQTLRFPVIVKPANLASSLLIQSCGSSAELRRALERTFESIQEMYRSEGRRQRPRVLVEEFLEGEYYSIDAYVMRRGEVYCCPPICYVPVKQLGIDDFAIYKRFLPVGLTEVQIAAAEETVRKAIAAVGLTYSSVHAELALTARGWKIIELGPRLGRFRHKMYSLGYSIDHSLNDIKIRLGRKPVVPTTLKRYCAAYKVLPKKEGILREISGIDALRANPLVSYLEIMAKPGQRCLFAKHGGRALAEFVLAADSPQRFAAICGDAEKVRAIVA